MMNSAFEAAKQQLSAGFFSEETKPFFNKGRGKSVMMSEFLVSHPDNPFFQLSHEEWKAVVSQYSELMEETDIDYIERSGQH